MRACAHAARHRSSMPAFGAKITHHVGLALLYPLLEVPLSPLQPLQADLVLVDAHLVHLDVCARTRRRRSRSAVRKSRASAPHPNWLFGDALARRVGRDADVAKAGTTHLRPSA